MYCQVSVPLNITCTTWTDKSNRRTDRKVKTEGPEIMTYIIIYLLTVIIDGPIKVNKLLVNIVEMISTNKSDVSCIFIDQESDGHWSV